MFQYVVMLFYVYYNEIFTGLSTFCLMNWCLNYQQALFMLCKILFNHFKNNIFLYRVFVLSTYVFPPFYSKRWRTSRRSTWSAGNSSTAWRLSPLSTPTRKCLQVPRNPSRVRALNTHTKEKQIYERDYHTLRGIQVNSEIWPSLLFFINMLMRWKLGLPFFFLTFFSNLC